MKKRPLSVRLVSLLFVLSPLGIVAELLYLYGIPLAQWTLVFNPGIWNWQVVACAVLTPLLGLAVWTVRRWAYWCLVAFSGLALANNVVLWLLGRGLSSQAWQRVLFVALVLGFALAILRRDFAAPYFNPRLRWWEQARRYCPGAFKVKFRRFGGGEPLFEATLFDISETGVFVESDRPAAIGDLFGVEVELAGGAVLHASAEVVRLAPNGFGCRFGTAESHFRAKMRHSLREMRAAVRAR